MEKNVNAYNHYVCPYCFYTLDKCTCDLFPPYHLLFIDRGIQDHIRILNQKGYKTNGCCESHYHGVCITIYISFGIDYGFGSTIQLPEGFKFNKRKRTIMYEFKNKISEDEMNIQKEQRLNDLLEWCKNLPNYNNKSA